MICIYIYIYICDACAAPRSTDSPRRARAPACLACCVSSACYVLSCHVFAVDDVLCVIISMRVNCAFGNR